MKRIISESLTWSPDYKHARKLSLLRFPFSMILWYSESMIYFQPDQPISFSCGNCTVNPAPVSAFPGMSRILLHRIPTCIFCFKLPEYASWIFDCSMTIFQEIALIASLQHSVRGIAVLASLLPSGSYPRILRHMILLLSGVIWW